LYGGPGLKASLFLHSLPMQNNNNHGRSWCVLTKRVESSPIQSSQTHKDAAVDSTVFLQWPPWQCVNTNRVESSRIESHESCCVKSLDVAYFIFISQTRVIGRDGCCLEEEMDVEKLILLVKDHEAIYNASRCEHRNQAFG